MQMGDHESRSTALEAARKGLEDSLIVMAHLETRQSNLIKLQADATGRIRKEMEEHRQMNLETDARIAKLASAIGGLSSRMPPPAL